MVVSPTYFGACADLAGLVEVAHEHGVPLAVDEAWGAHLRFHPDLPADALGSGADLVVSSTHKIVGSLTQAAMLHLGDGGRIDEAVVDRCVSLVETTSPSALLCGSLDAARRLPPSTASGCSTRPWPGSPPTREEIAEIPGLAVLDDSMVGRGGIAGWDPLRLAIDVRGTGVDRLPRGEDRLRARRRDRPRARRREPRRRDLRPRRAGRRSPASASSPPCASRSSGSARAGGAAAGAAGAAATLGRAGDDAARGVPRPAGGRPLRRGRPGGSRPSRWPPTRPASPTSCPASG